MKSKIIEIVELGQPKSLIQRENEPITELIDTNLLVEELNQALRLFAVSGSGLCEPSGYATTADMIYRLCKHHGAEIQVDINFDKGCTEYTLVEESGDTKAIRKDTFEKLKKVGAIQIKWKPAVFVERWG